VSATVSSTGSFAAGCRTPPWQLSRGSFWPVPHSEQELLQINITIFIATDGIYSHFMLAEAVSVSFGEQKSCLIFILWLIITLFCQACAASEFESVCSL